MSRGLRAYRCVGPDAPTWITCGGATPPGERIRLAPTIARALAQQAETEYGAWPVRVLEVTVEAADVLAVDDVRVLARAARVEREVLLDEAFGPRAGDVVAFIEQIRGIQWLRPEASCSSDRIAELIAEHYAALTDQRPVMPLPVCTLRTWREARDAHETVRAITPSIVVAVGASTRAADETAQCTMRVARQAAARLAYCGAWEAIWDAAVAGIPSEVWIHGSVDVDTIEAMVAALGAAREPARAAAWRVAMRVLTGAPGALPALESVYAEALAAAQHAYETCLAQRPLDSGERAFDAAAAVSGEPLRAFVRLTATVAWRLAVIAAFHASWCGALLINGVVRPDPWRPLVDLWRLGAAPAGASRGAFVVFLPEADQA